MPQNLDDFILGEPQAKETQPEAWIPYLGRQVVSGLEKVAEIPFGLHEAAQTANKIIPAAIPLPGRHLLEKSEQLGVPTTEEFRRGAEQKLGFKPGAFNPEGIGENILQETIKLGTTAGLGAGAEALAGGAGIGQALGAGAQTVKELAKPIVGTAIGGQAGEVIGNLFNLSEPAKGAMNLVGGLIGGSYGTRSKVVEEVNKNYDLARNNLPEGASFQTPKMAKVAESLENKVTKFPGYEKAEGTVEKFKNLLANENRVPIQDALDFKIALNAEYKNYPKKIRDQIITPMINSLKNDAIIPYGEQNESSLKFLKPWQIAEKDFAALRNKFVKTDAITNNIEKILEKYPDQLTLGAKKLLGFLLVGSGAGYTIWTNPIASGLGTAGLVGINELNKFSGLISSSPSAQRIVKEVTKQLSLGHTVNAIKIFNKGEKEVPELFKESEDDFILG